MMQPERLIAQTMESLFPKKRGPNLRKHKENVKCRQEFVGDDIAFCHWEADSKEAVLEWIEELGVSEFISTELHEQWRFSSFYNQSDELRAYKEFANYC